MGGSLTGEGSDIPKVCLEPHLDELATYFTAVITSISEGKCGLL